MRSKDTFTNTYIDLRKESRPSRVQSNAANTRGRVWCSCGKSQSLSSLVNPSISGTCVRGIRQEDEIRMGTGRKGRHLPEGNPISGTDMKESA